LSVILQCLIFEPSILTIKTPRAAPHVIVTSWGWHGVRVPILRRFGVVKVDSDQPPDVFMENYHFRSNQYPKYPRTVLASYVTFGAVWESHAFLPYLFSIAEGEGFNLFTPIETKCEMSKHISDSHNIYSIVYEKSSPQMLSIYFKHQPEEVDNLLQKASCIIYNSPQWKTFNIQKCEDSHNYILQQKKSAIKLIGVFAPS